MRCFIAIGMFLVLFGCKRSDSQADDTPAPASAVVAPVLKESLSSTLKVTGQFEPYQDVDLHAKVSGYIRRINVDIGDRVRNGQTIAILEVPELTAQVVGAKAEVRHSESEISRARSEISKAESAHAAVHEAYRRLDEAAKQRPGLVAEQELDDARAKDMDAEAQINVAKANLDATQQQLGVSQADTQRMQSLQDYAVVTAPFNGVVTKRYADTGSLIQAGTTSNTQAMPLVRLAQSDLLRLRMPVPEADVGFIKTGGEAQVLVRATGRAFTGKIVRFARLLDVSTRTMVVEIDVPNEDLGLSPGMFAEVTLTLQRADGVATVPAQAVIEGDHPAVLVVDGSHKVERREVEVGIQGSNRTEIRKGVAVGEQVIVAGQQNYQAGEEVRPIQREVR